MGVLLLYIQIVIIRTVQFIDTNSKRLCAIGCQSINIMINFYYFFFTEKNYLVSSLAMFVRLSVRPSVCHLWKKNLECDYTVCIRPISFKFGPNIYISVLHVWRSLFSKFDLQAADFCHLQVLANKIVCIVLTNLQSRFCWLLIYMYVIRWSISEIIDFLKLLFFW